MHAGCTLANDNVGDWSPGLYYHSVKQTDWPFAQVSMFRWILPGYCDRAPFNVILGPLTVAWRPSDFVSVAYSA
jgi:hypothetical protein